MWARACVTSHPPHIFLFCEPSIERILGYRLQDLVGQDLLTLCYRCSESFQLITSFLTDFEQKNDLIQIALQDCEGKIRDVMIKLVHDELNEVSSTIRSIFLSTSQATTLEQAMQNTGFARALVSPKPPYTVCTTNGEYNSLFKQSDDSFFSGMPLTNISATDSNELLGWTSLLMSAADGQEAEGIVNIRTTFCDSFPFRMCCTPVTSSRNARISLLAATFFPLLPPVALNSIPERFPSLPELWKTNLSSPNGKVSNSHSPGGRRAHGATSPPPPPPLRPLALRPPIPPGSGPLPARPGPRGTSHSSAAPGSSRGRAVSESDSPSPALASQFDPARRPAAQLPGSHEEVLDADGLAGGLMGPGPGPGRALSAFLGGLPPRLARPAAAPRPASGVARPTRGRPRSDGGPAAVILVDEAYVLRLQRRLRDAGRRIPRRSEPAGAPAGRPAVSVAVQEGGAADSSRAAVTLP